MDNHYDGRIIYSTDREHENLYQWSLKELDADGQTVGRDWIPWEWSLYFKAKDITLQEGWNTQERYPIDEAKGKRQTTETRSIRAELYPYSHDRRPPTYSMLGTDRNVSKFFLGIEQVSDDDEERCITYGVVSYTTDIDFRDVTEDDALYIYFHFRPATFAHYAQRIASGAVESLMLQINGVAGFYSDWSPSITTSNIRVLTADRDHKVEGVPDEAIIPRLGNVGEARIYFARELKLPLPAPSEAAEADFVPEDDPVDKRALAEVARETLAEVAREKFAQETVKLIRSLRVAAWVVAVLLLALLLK